MAAKRNAPDPRPSPRGRKKAALSSTISRGPAKNAHVCVLIQHAEYPSKTATRLPGKTSSAGVQLLHLVRLKRKRTAFFRPTHPLSRPRRRANSPSATPDVAQTQIDPARAPHLAALERGRLTTQETRFHIPSKARVLMRKVRRRDVHWSTWAPVERGASDSATCGARRSATAASLARALCAEAHKPWPNAAGERHSATTPLAADVAVGRRHSNRVADEDAQVMTKRHGCPNATLICK